MSPASPVAPGTRIARLAVATRVTVPKGHRPPPRPSPARSGNVDLTNKSGRRLSLCRRDSRTVRRVARAAVAAPSVPSAPVRRTTTPFEAGQDQRRPRSSRHGYLALPHL